MNKNGESYTNAIEGHRQRARCERLLEAQKGRVDTRLEAARLVEQQSNIFDEPIPNDPNPV